MPQTWSSFEVHVAVKMCEAIYPSGADPRLPLGAKDVGIDRFIPRLLAVIPLQAALVLRLAVWVVLFSPLLVGKGPRLFTGLSEKDQEEVMRRLSVHRIYYLRELSMLWKAYGGMGYGGDPRVQALLGMQEASGFGDVPDFDLKAAGNPSPAEEVISLGRPQGR